MNIIKKQVMRCCAFVLIAGITPFSVAASLYISDKVYVPVRKGQGNQFAILHKGLPSGTKVTLVERDTDWTKITTDEGITGWVRNQFLDEEPPAAIKLVIATQKLEKMTEQLNTLKEEKSLLQKNYEETRQELKQTDQQARKTAEELNSIKTISASAMESYQKLQTLAEKMQLLQTQSDVLKSENENLRRSERATFFLYGVFAMLMGVIVAIVVPKLRIKKRNNGWIN
jgi:SH3 domain protein